MARIPCIVPVRIAPLVALLALLVGAPAAVGQADLVAWGNDSHGQASAAPLGAGLVQVAGGKSHYVGLRADGSLLSWGSDVYGQISQTPLGKGFVMVTAGNDHSIALHASGTIHAWGRDQLSQVSGAPGGASWAAVSAASHNSLAVGKDGSLFGWGNDAKCSVSCVPTDTGYIAVAAPHAALRSDGSIQIWGTGLPAPPTGTVLTDLSINGSTRVGLQPDGSLMAWSTYDFSGIVSQLPAGNDFIDVAAGGECAMALRSNGQIVVWGKNTDGIQSSAPTSTGFTGIPEVFMTTGVGLRETDCNMNGVLDALDIATGTSIDCNDNGVPDECELTNPALDQNQNGVLDACEPDSGLSISKGKAYLANPVLLGLPNTPNGTAVVELAGFPGGFTTNVEVNGGASSFTIPPLTGPSSANVTADLIVRWTELGGAPAEFTWPDAYTWEVPRIVEVTPPAVPFAKNKIIQVITEGGFLTSGVGTATFADGPVVAAVAYNSFGFAVISTVAPALAAPGSYPIEFRFEDGGVVEYTRVESGALVHLGDGIQAMSRIDGAQGGGDGVDFELEGFVPGKPVSVWFGDAEVVGVPTGYPELSTLTVEAPASFAWGTVDVRVVQDQAQLGIHTSLSPAAWTYDPPVLYAVQPASGWQTGGLAAQVVVEGFDTGPATVELGGTTTAGQVVDAPEGGGLQLVRFTTPPGPAPGPVDVRVVQGVYDRTLQDAFTYIAPQASGLTPALGPWYLATDFSAQVEGFDVAQPVTARIGDSAPVPATLDAGGTLTFQLPASAVGGAGSQILFVEQQSATAVLKAAWHSLPDLAVQVTGSSHAGGDVALRIRAGEPGTAWILAGPAAVPDPVPIFGVHHGLLLDATVGQVFGKVQVTGAVPTVSFPFAAGAFASGTTLYAQALVLEPGHGLGTLASFTNAVLLEIP